MDVSLVNATLENMELLAGVSIPQQQNQYVNFELSAVGYEIAGNPWAFIILADGCVAGYLCCDELQGGELMIKKFVVGAEFQRRGIGSAALELLRAAAREAGCREIYLSVAADNSPRRTSIPGAVSRWMKAAVRSKVAGSAVIFFLINKHYMLFASQF